MTGLKLNPNKSSMLLFGVIDILASGLYHVTCFKSMDGDMKYLGLLLITKRITFANCLPLYKKITEPLNFWSNRHLCGRLVLIKSASFYMMVYWACIMILPHKLLNLFRFFGQIQYTQWNSYHVLFPVLKLLWSREDWVLSTFNYGIYKPLAYILTTCWVVKTVFGVIGFGITALRRKIFGTWKYLNCIVGHGENYWGSELCFYLLCKTTLLAATQLVFGMSLG